jgi:hypothetical protein
MTEADMRRHAEEWIAAWNRRDVEQVLEAFHDDARFVSLKAHRITGRALVEGKAALRSYWNKAVPSLTATFRLDHVLCDPGKREMVLIYDRVDGAKYTRACEFMRFDEGGRQIEGEAMLGAELGDG